jgi:hypothetical protein
MNWWKAPVARAAVTRSAARPKNITVADIIVAVDEPIDATGCGGKENCMGEDSGRCMTHDLWASLNSKMIEYLDSISLRKLVDEQLAKGISIEEHPVKRAISTQPVVKPIKRHAPNSVFAFGNLVALQQVSSALQAFLKSIAMDMTPHFPIYMDYGATTPSTSAWSTR